MAKISFSKLGLTKNNNINKVIYNDQTIEVKEYLSINDKAEIAANVLGYTVGSGAIRFANPLQIEVYTVLQIIEKYTNITFTDKQKEDPAKLYDLIIGSGFWILIKDAININDYNDIIRYINESLESFYKYYNSVYGILDNIGKDYETLNLDATEIQQKLADPQNMTLLKDVLAKLG